jgi:prepilin-type N-terminal cleavage/methylation domain-containing protein
MASHRRKRPGAGFTLLELAIALAIAVVLAAVAVPSYGDLVARQRLHAVVEHLRADIALARREAGARALSVRIGFLPGDDWCYVLTTGVSTDCRQAADGGAASGRIKRVRGQDNPGVRLLQAQTMELDGRNGAQPGGETWARFGLADGRQLQVRLGPMGHASVCAPATPVAGVPRCPQPTSPT